jgi:POT family proton-dependent oligopeptide transporter
MASDLTAVGSKSPGLPGADGLAALPAASDWFGQPRGLTVLFLTDMWEQFSFFGMRALLVYYMMKQLLLGQETASLIYGVYSAFVYFTPIVGGVISDRWLGRRNSVVIGGSIMALGHFMMAFEPMFYLALATIAIGNGLFLPSLPSQINGLYRQDDPRRRSAYNFYYVGVNVGAFFAPFACGTIGELYGWHWGFTVAGVGMVVGLITYLVGQRHLPSEPSRAVLRAQTSTHVASTDALASTGGPASAGASERWRRFALLAGIAGIVVIFRAAYEQTGNTLSLWIEHSDRAAGSFVIPMTWFQSLNPMFVFLLTPFLVSWWLRMAREGREPSSIRKMAIGAVVVALSYLMLASVAEWGSAAPSWIWIVVFFIVMTMGELFILPIGLGLFGRLAPQGFSATTIALWFFAAFAGNLLAGVLGAAWSHVSTAQFFTIAAIVAAASGLLLLIFDPAIRRLSAD